MDRVNRPYIQISRCIQRSDSTFWNQTLQDNRVLFGVTNNPCSITIYIHMFSKHLLSKRLFTNNCKVTRVLLARCSAEEGGEMRAAVSLSRVEAKRGSSLECSADGRRSTERKLSFQTTNRQSDPIYSAASALCLRRPYWKTEIANY